MIFSADPNGRPGVEIIPENDDEKSQLADILAENLPELFQELEMYDTVLLEEKGLSDEVLERFQLADGSIAEETGELHSVIDQAWRERNNGNA